MINIFINHQIIALNILQQIIMSSKANQILKNLNSQIQHINPIPPPQPNPNPINNNLPNQQTLDTSNYANPPQSQLTTQIPKSKIFENQLRYEQNRQAPEFLTEMLQKQIGVLINVNLSEIIESITRQREKNTYDAFTKEGQENAYIRILYDQTQKKTDFFTSAVSNMLSKRQSKVQGDIEKGGIIIQYDRNLTNKNQLQYLWQADLARMIKIKDGELRSKLDILNDKMQKFDSYGHDDEQKKKMEEQVNKKVVQNMDFNNYSLDSQKTKIAKDYVRYIHQQKKLLEKKRHQRLKRYEQSEKQRQTELKQAQEMRDLAKKQQILQRIDARRKKRQEQQKQELIKQEQVKKLLDQHHKKLPIFKIKERQFQQKIVKPQQKLYQQKLNQIRDYKKSMSLNQIKTHEQKYLVKLQLQQKKRQQQFKMILKSRKSQDIIHRYYKGSAHKRIDQSTKQQQLRNYSMRQASKIKANRMKEYNEVISKMHKPTVDQDKKKELLKLIQIDLMRKKHVKKVFKQIMDENTKEVKFQEYFQEIPQKDHYKQGNKFLQYSKQHIKRKQKQTNIQKIQELQSQSHSRATKLKLLQGSSTQPKKQKNVWQLRAKQLQQFAASDVVDAKVFQYVKQNIQNLDNKAAEKQDLLKKLNLSMEEHINQKGKLDHFYLSSIKQKMRLLQ